MRGDDGNRLPEPKTPSMNRQGRSTLHVRHYLGMRCAALAGIFVAGALLLSPHDVANAGEASASSPPHLLVPYPITGPREIQASDRITRRYRAVAARAVPPITDAMASMIEAALLVGLDVRVVKMRRDDPDAFDWLHRETNSNRNTITTLLLADDDVVRSADRRTLARESRLAAEAKLIDPIVEMPFVLLCVTVRCNVTGAPSPNRLAAVAASRPRTLGSSGERSTSHLAAQAWSRHLGLASLLVPFGGGNAVVSALVAGQIDAAFVATPLALSYIGHGKVHALAIASEQRFERLPDLPTLREAGLPVVVESWFAVFGPAQLSAQTAARVGASIRAYRLEQATRAEWIARGLIPIAATTEQFELRIQSERRRTRTDSP